MTIGDVMKQLPFDEKRAERVAITEVTRAYAAANKLAGEELAKEFPDLKVIKRWFTNNDGLVCTAICAPLNGKEVDLNAEFAPGISEPPGHPGCRCWSSVKTELPDE